MPHDEQQEFKIHPVLVHAISHCDSWHILYPLLKRVLQNCKIFICIYSYSISDSFTLLTLEFLPFREKTKCTVQSLANCRVHVSACHSIWCLISVKFCSNCHLQLQKQMFGLQCKWSTADSFYKQHAAPYRHLHYGF